MISFVKYIIWSMRKNYVFKVSLIKAGIYILLAAVIIEYKPIMKMGSA